MIYSRPRLRTDGTSATPSMVPLAEHQSAVRQARIAQEAAEKRLAEIEAGGSSGADVERLERENAQLRSRLETATKDLGEARSRVGYLESQIAKRKRG